MIRLPAYTSLQERVAAAAPLLARAVGSVLASHALLPLHPFLDEDDENALCTACAARPATQLVINGQRLVACFCRAFEASAWHCHADTLLADQPGGDDTSKTTQSENTCLLMTTQRRQSWLPASASALVAHLGAVAVGDVDATPAAIQAMISLECNDLARQHLGTARVAASAAVRGAAAAEDRAEIVAAGLRLPLQRAAADALACAVLVAAASLASRVQAVAFALPLHIRQCGIDAGSSRCVWRFL